VSFAPPAAVPRAAPLGYRGSLGRDADLLPLRYAMRAAGVTTSEVCPGLMRPVCCPIEHHGHITPEGKANFVSTRSF